MSLQTALRTLTATALLFSVAGCGGAAQEEGRSFTYWSMWKENEPQAKVLSEAIAAFERETGLDVEVQWQGRDVLKKVVPALRGGDVPDLVDQEEAVVRANLVASGQFRDLTQVVAKGIDPKYLGTLKQNGETFLVPYEVIGNGLWFNAAALPDVAAAPPKTWNDFTALLQKRKAEGNTPLALDGDIGYYNAYWTVGMLQGALGPGMVEKLARDTSGTAWDTPAVRTVLEEVRGLRQYFAPGYDGSKWPAVQERWAQGQADFLLMGSWAPSETGAKAAQGFRYRYAPLPGEKISLPVNTLGFAIPKPARNAAAAQRFITFFQQDEHLTKIATEAKNLTPNPALPVPEDLQGLAEALRTHPISRPVDGIDEIPGYADEVFYPVNDQLIKGRADVATALADLATRQANYWKKNG